MNNKERGPFWDFMFAYPWPVTWVTVMAMWIIYDLLRELIR